ncbi:MAG: hypothetical protein KAR01_03285 [Desulfocapsa sp.]|nr:hypothetical protein [Desulfocapsa sp.]
MKIMNGSILKFGLAVFGCFMLANTAGAALKQQVVTLEAAGNIEDVSQEITKAYFYNQLEIRVVQAKRDISEGLERLDNSIVVLSKEASTDEEVKGILTFIEFSRDEMKTIITQPYSEENGAMMLDFSESLLEGATLIGKKQLSENDVEQMGLVTVKQMEFLLERINKYYIAHKAGFKDYNNVVQLKKAIEAFEANLKKVNAYSYPASLQPSIEKINKFWPIAKKFYLGIEKGALPIIVMSSTNNLERSLHTLQDYHLKKMTAK